MELRVTQDATHDDSELRAALDALQLRYDALADASAARIQQLEDENEALAEANRLLLERSQSEAAAQPATPAAAAGQLGASGVPDELLEPGAGIATRELLALRDPHATGNLLSVAVHAGRRAVVLTGGADKRICAHDWRRRRTLAELGVSAPVLALAFHPRLVDVFAAALMDGRHGLFRLVRDAGVDDIVDDIVDGFNGDGEAGDAADNASEHVVGWRLEAVQLFHEHTRPGAMKLTWSSDGALFATGASDKTAHIFRCAHLDARTPGEATCAKVRSFYFNGAVEAMAFVPPPRAADALEEPLESAAPRSELLAVAVREDCYVHYVDCATFEKERVNMNQDGIEHVSYTIMDLRVSPSGKYLLAATDSSRLFVFAIKSNVVLRNFYGHKAGPYSQPRALWHPSEKYVLANTEESGAVFVWCVASERVVETLTAHDALVRDFDISADSGSTHQQVTLYTVSYDKLLKVWSTSVAASAFPTASS